jgi:hypothetical protein
MWLQHDGASPYYSRELRQWRAGNNPGRWIGRGREAPVFWHEHTPDLNTLYFFV